MNRPADDFERLAQNLWLERELLRVHELLEGIPFVVFKGVFLSTRLYGSLTQRASADNDVLVRAGDGERALDRLIAAGFAPVLDGLDARSALRRMGQVALVPHAEGRPSLDLHVRAFSANFFRVDEDWLWSKHLRSVELHGRTFSTFDDDLAFCHLVAHYLQHLFETDRLADIARGVETLLRDDDGGSLDDAVRHTVGWRAVSFSTAMAGAPLSRPLSDPDEEVFLRLALGIFRRLDLTRAPTVLRGGFAAALTDPRAWSGAVRQAFLPARDELEARYGPGRPGGLFLRHLRHRLLGR